MPDSAGALPHEVGVGDADLRSEHADSPVAGVLGIVLAEQTAITGTSAHASLTHWLENESAPEPAEADSGAA